jgi:glyoxylase-like metal-dependent hydrolase (beta-lactamase superfamily II)
LFDHRSVLRALIVLLAAAASVSAQAPIRTADISARGLSAADFPRLSALAEGVYAYEQVDPTKGNVTVNNLIVITPSGIVVADGQGTIDNTRQLLADLAALSDRPVTHVVVASEHGDHTGGNAAFPASAIFYASAASTRRLRTQAEQPRRPGAPALIVPTTVVPQDRPLVLPGTDVEVRFVGRAHTGGDLILYLPKVRIVYASEIFLNRIFPSMANGYPSEWVAALRSLEALDADIYVPAHGFVDSPAVLKEELRNYRLAIERVISEGRRLHAAGVPAARAADAADLGELRNWTRFTNNAAAAFARVYQEIEGTLPE